MSHTTVTMVRDAGDHAVTHRPRIYSKSLSAADPNPIFFIRIIPSGYKVAERDQSVTHDRSIFVMSEVDRREEWRPSMMDVCNFVDLFPKSSR